MFTKFDTENYPTLHVDTMAVARAVQAGDLAAYAQVSGNALEGPAIALMEDVAHAMQQLKDAGAAAVRMSGSGSAVFGVFADDATAQAVCEILHARWERTWFCHTCMESVVTDHAD